MAVETFLSHSNLTLCDYFAVIGFDKSNGLQVDKCAESASDLVSSSLNEAQKSPLNRSYEAKVLYHFPNHRENFQFVPEIASLCMPKGLKLYTERKVPKEPNFHSFVLIREDGTRVNGCALIFYEPLLEADIRQQIYDFQIEQIKEMSNASSITNHSTGGENSNKGEPFAIPQFSPGTVTSGNHTLPRKLPSKRFTRATTTERFQSNESPHRQQHQRNYSVAQNCKRDSFYDNVSKPIFVSKCICFVTRAPIVFSIENLLRSLYAILRGKFCFLASPSMPLESVIYWALHEIPLPLPGTCLNLCYGECNLVVKRPSGQELPFFDYPVQILFNYITVERFIKLFTCFLLEHQILLCSKHLDRLMLVAECLSVLIFPFRWQLTYVPILPYSQLKFIEAPVPYLMGLCYDDKIPDQIFQSNVCIFDIDKGRLDYPEDIPSFPRQRQIVEGIMQIQERFRSQPKSTINDKSSSHGTKSGGVVLRRQARSSFRNSRDENADSNSRTSARQRPRRHNELYSSKRMSRSFDNEISFEDLSNLEDIHNFQENEALKLLEAENLSAAQKDGFSKFENSTQSALNGSGAGCCLNNNLVEKARADSFNAYLNGLKFNHSIRELFLCHFASLFASYEHFLIGSQNGESEEKENRESIVNFDKASFLSDQPESYLPFLAAFLETQMFTSFVDSKILSHCQPQSEESKYLLYFDRKINFFLSVTAENDPNANQSNVIFSENHRTTTTERPLDFLFTSSNFLRHQKESIESNIVISADYEVEVPHLLDSSTKLFLVPKPDAPLTPQHSVLNQVSNIFPDLNAKTFERDLRCNIGSDGSVMSSPWKQQQRVLLEDATSRLALSSQNLTEPPVESPMRMAHQNWRFVEQLLKETKTKTKRMLVAKMGKEAVHLGHCDLGIIGVEENTLVAGFCDLLERIWAHGLKKKQGKSALWSNIFAHYDREKFENLKPHGRYSNLSPEIRANGLSDSASQLYLLSSKLNDENKDFVPVQSVLEPQEKDLQIVDENSNAKTLNDLLDSIRSIAQSIELLPVDNDNNNNLKKSADIVNQFENNKLITRNNSASQQEKLLNDNRPVEKCVHQQKSLVQNRQKAENEKRLAGNNNERSRNDSNWFGSIRSTSLIRAANFIYDKIDKISAVDVPRQIFVKPPTSLSAFFGDESVSNGKPKIQFLKQSDDENVNTEDVRKGRSTERRSNTNSDSSLPPIEQNKRNESKPRFYHHEDDHSKKLRQASRQRREAAATAAAFHNAATAHQHNLKNKNILKNNINKSISDIDNTLFPAAPMIKGRLRDDDVPNLKTSKLEATAQEIAAELSEFRKKSGQEQQQRLGFHKSCSVSDFAPQWSVKGLSSSSEVGFDVSNGQHQFVTVGESNTLGRVGRNAGHKELRQRSLSRSRGVFSSVAGGSETFDAERNLPPLPTHMAYDLKNVMRMTEIKTDIGFARAFVRLALERKLLYKHLKAVLANPQLLQKMYKRYAFLRCEDEREQFLYHVLSLNAADFSCFTHTFISTKMSYQVLLVAGIDRFSSSSIWIMLAGSLGTTSKIYLPSNSLQFTFDFKNLGMLSTLRIGHSAGKKGAYPSKWFLEYVLVRNNITAQTFCFNCSKWFGRGVDDGALERLLVADNIHPNSSASELDNELKNFDFSKSSFQNNNNNNNVSESGGNNAGTFGLSNFISRPESPVSSATALLPQKLNLNFYSTGSLTRRRRSPSVGQSGEYVSKQLAPKISELQHKLGMAVNALVKHFFVEKDYRSGARLTPLLCGENGLVPCLEQVFELGRQDTLFSNRFFRQPYPWDYIERVFSWFANFFCNGESRKLTQEQRSLIIYAYNLIVKISANTAVGKEGKFHIFILLTLRDHILSGLLSLMAWTPVTAQIYDESAFLRQSHHLTYLSKLLNSLNEFNFTLEKSLIYGVEL